MRKNDNFDIVNIYQYNFKNLEKNYITINKRRRKLFLRISLPAILYYLFSNINFISGRTLEIFGLVID